MPKWKDPNPPWPVAMFKLVDGNLLTEYAHNEKEFERYTADPLEGGKGFQTTPIFVEYPKAMSHPNPGIVDVIAKSKTEEAAYRAKGYSTDHYANKQAKSEIDDTSAAPASFDPKARARIDQLEDKIQKQSRQIDELLELATSKKK